MQTRHYFGVQLKLAPWRAAFVLAPLLFSGSTGALSNSQSGAVQPLPLGVAIERELAGGQSHLYELTLSLGQYAQVIIKQESIDLKASLFGPDGKLIVEVDATPQGRERVLLIAESAGAYRLAIQPTAQKAPATGYTVTLTESRAANEQDKRQIAADRAMLQGGQLLRKETAEALRQAVSKLDEATNASRVAGDRVIEAIALSYLGAAYDNLGQKQQALDSYHKSLSLSQALQDRYLEAGALNELGLVYNSLGDKPKAVDHFRRALSLYRELKLPAESSALQNLAIAYDSMGEKQTALDYYRQALSIARAVGDRLTEAQALTGIGLTYDSLGEPQKAVEFHLQSLPIARELRSLFGEAVILNNIGLAYSRLGDYPKAIDFWNQSLPLRRKVGDRGGEARTLNGLAWLYSRLGEYQKAHESYTQALDLSRQVNDRRQEGVILGNLAENYARQGDYPKSLELFQQTLSLMRAVASRDGEAIYAMDMARVLLEVGNLDEARVQLEAAINIIESIRSKLASQDLRSSFMAVSLRPYELQIEALMRLGERRPAEGLEAAALQVSERARARSLLELLVEARVNFRQDVDPELIARERALQQQLNAKAAEQARLLGGRKTEAQAAPVAREIADLTARHRDLQAQIRRASPQYAALTQPPLLAVSEIQQLLDRDTMLLEYALGGRRSYLWAVTTDSVISFQLPPRAEIEAAARKVYELLTARQPKAGLTEAQQRARVASAEAEFKTQAAALSRMLLGPVASQLGNKRLAIVASGALEYIPFAALPDPSVTAAANYQPLIAAHEVVNLPSASSLAVIRGETASRRPAEKTVAVLADPVFETNDPRVALARKRKSSGAGDAQIAANAQPAGAASLERAMRSFDAATGRAGLSRLPFSREEAEAIAALAPAGQVLKATGFRANRATATGEELGRYRIVHFATHGLLNGEHPELSGLVFSLVDENGKPQDGFLRLHEIFNLRLPADVVTLSACQTALGREVRGEGLVGLTRGFMYAGAPRVVASLWQVEDLATAELMKRFYQGMLKDGLRPAAALRAAQIEMAKQKRWASPFFWSAFVIQGDWK